jgi:sugar O-acyltransferase (sialic acid O-acetyltransferase NeuD family)
MDNIRKLVILGAGGHGKAVAEAAELSGDWTEIVFMDDNHPVQTQSGAWRIVGTTRELGQLAGACAAAIVAVGNQHVREHLSQSLGALGIPLATIVHPKAYVSSHAVVGPGSAIMAGAIVGTGATLGCGVIVNANATVDHDAALGDFAHLGVGVQLAGGVVIGARAWLQAGSCAGYRVNVAPGAIVKPGSSLSAD